MIFTECARNRGHYETKNEYLQSEERVPGNTNTRWQKGLGLKFFFVIYQLKGLKQGEKEEEKIAV